MPRPGEVDINDFETLVEKIRFMASKYEDDLFINDWEFSFIDSMVQKLLNIERGNITEIDDKMFSLSSRQRWCFDKIWDKYLKEYGG